MTGRILFVSYTADWRGPTNSLLRLLTRLRERYEVGVLLTGEGRFRDELEQMGVPVHGFPDLSKWSVAGMAGAIRSGEYDLVYANSTHGSSRNAFLAAKLTRTPFLCHVRSMAWDKGWSRLGYLWFADAVVAVSDACARSVRRFVRNGRLHRVYNGVPLSRGEGGNVDGAQEKEPPGSGSLRDEIDARPADTVLLSVAHVCERKGQLDAVRMMPDVLSRVPGGRLCLAGATDRDPAYTERVRSIASQTGVGDNVHLLGFRSDVPALLQEADVFIHTARQDPHPRAVIEAMHAELPVVAYRVDGVGETVVDGETGTLVNPGDERGLAEAVVELAGDPGLRRRMGAAGRKRVEDHFTADGAAAQIAGIIDDLI